MTGTKQIWIRRGLCRPCQKTFTVLPDWSPPSGHYSLHCRQQAWELLRQADGSWERSIPDCRRSVAVARSVYRATMGADACCIWEPCWWLKLWQAIGWSAFDVTHHPCLGLDRDPPYSAVGGKKSVNRQALDDLKQQIPLLDYLQAHDWRPARPTQPRPMDGAVPAA